MNQQPFATNYEARAKSRAKRYARLLARADLTIAAAHFAAACSASRSHSRVAARALAKYGDHGPQISGCVREHFPESVKDLLRLRARQVTAASDKAWQARPARVRTETMRALAQAVATRDGSGFYGPRP